MARVIVVANRLPIRVHENVIVRTDGGVVVGIGGFHDTHPDSFWMGSTDVSFSSLGEELEKLRLGIVEVPSNLYPNYYQGFCNSELWPLFHEMPEWMNHTATWGAYRAVNYLFADAILKEVKGEDTIWLHDYHLMILPSLLRKARPDLRIGFFLHIPFPPIETFQILPQAHVLVEGLLGADAIGFHTGDYVENFTKAAETLGFKVEANYVFHNSRRTCLHVTPLGVDAKGIKARMRAPTNKTRLRKLRRRYEGRKVLIGADRLDYIKGIPNRLRAYKLFLKEHPEWVGKVVLLQIMALSRENIPAYRILRREVERVIGEINEEFSREGHLAVETFLESFPQENLFTYYRLADVLLVTSLCDGLNLLAKEYPAVKQGKPGVLILSPFAGAAKELPEALIVDPHDEKALAQAIWQALTMTQEESIGMMQSLLQHVMDNSNATWSTRCLAAIDEAHAMNDKEVS